MGLVERTHPEDIKAAIRKRYRSMAAFERAEGLATNSVTQVLRGRPSRQTYAAVERVLRDLAWSTESMNVVDSAVAPVPHRLNAEAL